MWSRTKSQRHTARSWVWLCHALNGSRYGSHLSQVVENMAERVGFEPTLEFPLNTLSKRAPSATRPSLREKSGKELLFRARFLSAPNFGPRPKRAFDPLALAASFCGSFQFYG